MARQNRLITLKKGQNRAKTVGLSASADGVTATIEARHWWAQIFTLNKTYSGLGTPLDGFYLQPR